MTESTERPAPSTGFWAISGLALVWNIIGIATYLMTVTMSPDALAALPEPERALHSSVPAWATGAYAIAVFAGTLGCIGLLLRRAWATPVLVLSLAGIAVQMGHAFFLSSMLEVMGATSAILPIVLIVIALYLVWFARSSAAKGWLR
ncbi:MAG: hypothetical protein KJZ74_03530 [Gemmatimonadales bacterium]|nr:hypothetical protein [Gemmatimonadales bacterium]